MQSIRLIVGLAEIGIDTPGRWCRLGLFIRDSGELAGDCGIHVQACDPRQVEVGITLARAFQGRGLATEALKAVLDYLFMKLGEASGLRIGGSRKRALDRASRASRHAPRGAFRGEPVVRGYLGMT